MYWKVLQNSLKYKYIFLTSFPIIQYFNLCCSVLFSFLLFILICFYFLLHCLLSQTPCPSQTHITSPVSLSPRDVVLSMSHSYKAEGRTQITLTSVLPARYLCHINFLFPSAHSQKNMQPCRWGTNIMAAQQLISWLFC